MFWGLFPNAGSKQASISVTSDVQFANSFDSAGQTTVFTTDTTVGTDGERGAFYDLATDKFYSTMTVSPANPPSYPYSWGLELLKKKKGVQTIGREQNNSGTSFTLTTQGKIWFGGNNCNEWSFITGCSSGQVQVVKPPGTYTCSTVGLGVFDPAPGSGKHCLLEIPMNIFKIVAWPAYANITFSNEVKVY
jgi:hypothetical protein